MLSSLISLGRNNNSTHTLIRGRFLSATQLAIVAVFSLGLCLATNSQVSAQEPAPPAIEDFRVNWEAVDEEALVFRFTFTGTIVNCDEFSNPIIQLLGFPFDGSTLPDSEGAFSIEILASAEIAFGRTIQAAITQSGLEISENFYTST